MPDPYIEQYLYTPGPSVTVSLPFTVDVSGLTAELFGEAYDLCGTILHVTTPIPLSALYNESTNRAWLNYIQIDNENTFEVYVNNTIANSLINAVKQSLYLADGAAYNVAWIGVDHITTYGAFTETDLNSNQYYCIQDFILSHLANSIFGHPRALAPIANDSVIRSRVSYILPKELEVVRGAAGRSFNLVGAQQLPTLTDLRLGILSASGVAGGLSTSALNMIVQQIMNQAPGRFQKGDKGFLMPVKWAIGDKLMIQLNITQNSYGLYNSASIPTFPGGYILNANILTPVNGTKYAIPDCSFVLEFIVGAG